MAVNDLQAAYTRGLQLLSHWTNIPLTGLQAAYTRGLQRRRHHIIVRILVPSSRVHARVATAVRAVLWPMHGLLCAS